MNREQYRKEFEGRKQYAKDMLPDFFFEILMEILEKLNRGQQP